jgi:hypothetical protein
VIAHPSAGAKEALGDAAIWMNRSNVDGWIEAVNRLQDPSEWAVWSSKARQRFDSFNPDDAIDQFAEAIESLVGVPCA